ncbi:unnamed protein product [Larinioides sclopetarius]|uniref:Uncharacterized protein n=1 Tax=Larinioides sclopetarius TaxID=280406 RepID=A0AAV1ZF95_9ARAC
MWQLCNNLDQTSPKFLNCQHVSTRLKRKSRIPGARFCFRIKKIIIIILGLAEHGPIRCQPSFMERKFCTYMQFMRCCMKRCPLFRM